jgi:MSHA biogenesis protein MshE
MDMGVEGYLLASTLRTIIAQRLVRRVCQSCGEDYTPTEFEAGWLRDDLLIDVSRYQYKKGRGCKQCGETGYQGRMGVYELLDMNAELAEKLRHDDSQGFVEAAERAPGYQPLVMVAHEHAVNGLTTIEEMLRLAGEVPDDVLDHPPVLEIDD